MSRRSDIRMYVEHLFEGRTLTKETIELKEEVYGNLVARYDDYVAQGMSDDEAYRRTCEAVTSLDDVLGEAGAGTGAGSAGQPADATAVRPEPSFAAAPAPDGGPVPPTVGAAPSDVRAPRRWTAGKIVAVVVGALAVVAVVCAVVFGVTGAQQATVVQTSPAPDVVLTDDGSAQQDGTQTTTGQTTTTGNGNGYGSGTGSGSGQHHGNGAGTATGIDAEVYAHDPAAVAQSTLASSGQSAVENVMAGLPLASYVTEVTADPGTRSAAITLTYQDRDQLAYDDDCVDRALAYDVVTLLSGVSDLDTIEFHEVENGHDPDYDRHVFTRSAVERILGTQLTPDLLTNGSWDAVRDQVMGSYAWDAIWESSDVD